MADLNNLTAVLHKVDDLRLEQWPLPKKPGNNEVLLLTYCVGICGSDVHYWKSGGCGNWALKKPMILGHETCAEVVEVGPNVKQFKVGDRVCTEPAVPCRICSLCKEGQYNLCRKLWCHATPTQNGTLTKYFLHPADYTFKIPDNMSNEEGPVTDEPEAMIEPLTVAAYACKRAQVSVGSNVLITGDGSIDLLNIMVAKALGANKVMITDIQCKHEQRLKLAKQIGADHTLLITSDSKEEEVIQNVKKQMGCSPNITIECSGAPPSTRLALLVTKEGGTVLLVGLGPYEMNLPLADAAILREITITGSLRYRNCFPLSIELVNSGRVDLKPLISHRFTFDKCLDAFITAFKRQGVKVIIKLRDD